MDHTYPEQVAACAEQLKKWRPSLDILVNNAGVGSTSTSAPCG